MYVCMYERPVEVLAVVCAFVCNSLYLPACVYVCVCVWWNVWRETFRFIYLGPVSTGMYVRIHIGIRAILIIPIG